MTIDLDPQDLGAERRLLDELVARFEATLGEPPSEATTVAFAALARGVRRHLRREDEGLLAGLTDQPGKPAVGSVRREHEPIRDLLAEIEEALRHGRDTGVLGNTRELAAALALHHRRLDALMSAQPLAARG